MVNITMMSEYVFNETAGYLEGLVRGFKNGILSNTDYLNLVQCETLEDLKLHLQSTDYGNFLANETGSLTVGTIDEKLREKLVIEFQHMRHNAVEPLSTFLDFITYGYMIDNIVLLLTGTLHHRPISELIPKCHPLGTFEQMEAIHVASSPSELYNAVLVDTPLAPFIRESVSEDELNEVNVEIIRNTLYKSYLEAFHEFCRKEIGGPTGEVMCQMLAFEADRRCFMITINSFNTELTKEARAKLYPRCGQLYPDGLLLLARAEDYDQVKAAAEFYTDYAKLFNASGNAPGEKALEDKFFEEEVNLHVLSFMQQFHYGVFFSYLKLKEQECRNLVWISECIAQRNKAKIDNYIPIGLSTNTR